MLKDNVSSRFHEEKIKREGKRMISGFELPEDFREFDPSLIKTIQLFNKDYSKVRVKIHYMEGKADSYIDFPIGSQLDLQYDYEKKEVTYNGKLVEMLDLNNGNTSDDIKFNGYGESTKDTVYYKAGDMLGLNPEQLLIDFKERKLHTVVDPDGIDNGGTGPLAIMVAHKLEEDSETIRMSIKKPFKRAFDPTPIKTIQLYNENYSKISLKVRYMDETSSSTIDFSAGSELNLEYNSENHEVTHNGKLVKMLDLNDGGTSDDIKFNGYGDSEEDTVYYKAGDILGLNPEQLLIDFGNGYLLLAGDPDGIDGNRAGFIVSHILNEAPETIRMSLRYRSFDPENVEKLQLYNRDYPAPNVVIQYMDGHSDEKIGYFEPGDTLDFEYNSESKEVTRGGKRVKIIDLNDGGSSDDIKFNGHDGIPDNTVFYKSKSREEDKLLDFNSGVMHTVRDKDGIDGDGDGFIIAHRSSTPGMLRMSIKRNI